MLIRGGGQHERPGQNSVGSKLDSLVVTVAGSEVSSGALAVIARRTVSPE